jgi:ATP-dependent DNA ligase
MNKGEPVKLVAFDLIILNGESVTGNSIQERRNMLERLHADMFDLFDVACSLNLETRKTTCDIFAGMELGWDVSEVIE